MVPCMAASASATAYLTHRHFYMQTRGDGHRGTLYHLSHACVWMCVRQPSQLGICLSGRIHMGSWPAWRDLLSMSDQHIDISISIDIYTYRYLCCGGCVLWCILFIVWDVSKLLWLQCGGSWGADVILDQLLKGFHHYRFVIHWNFRSRNKH